MYEKKRENTNHSEIDELWILERVHQPNQPRCFSGRQNISLHQHMFDLCCRPKANIRKNPSSEKAKRKEEKKNTNFIHLCQRSLLHFLQRAHLPRIRLPSEIHTPITPLPDLSDDPELVDFQLGAPFAEEHPFSSQVGPLLGLVLCRVGGEGAGGGGFGEGGVAELASVQIVQ